MKLKEEFCWLYGVYLGDGFRIINKKNIKKFKENIGFSIKRKQKFLNSINL